MGTSTRSIQLSLRSNQDGASKVIDSKTETKAEPLFRILNPNTECKLAETSIYSYLTDGDMTNLAVNKSFLTRTISDRRWQEKLKLALYDGLDLNRLLISLENGHLQQVEQKTSGMMNDQTNELLQARIKGFFSELQDRGIRNFQTIYARFKKVCLIARPRMQPRLDEDKFILLSSHFDSIKDWLSTNRNKVLRNQSLGLEGRSAIFYITISGFSEGLRLYQQQGFDVTVRDIYGEGIQNYAGFSGNVRTMHVCAKEFKLDMSVINCKGIGVQHFAAYSANPSALRACKTDFHLNMKALTKQKLGVQHESAMSGNPESIRVCDKEFKLPMTLLADGKSSIQHLTARSGSSEAILLCNEMKLDMKALNNNKMGLQHKAALSGKYAALQTCRQLGLDMTAVDIDGANILQCASNRESMRFCRDTQFDLKTVTAVGDYKGFGVQHRVTQFGTPDDLQFCVDVGIDFSAKDQLGHAPSHWAAENGNAHALRFLKKNGKDLYVKNEEGLGIQYSAASYGDPLTILMCAELGLEMKPIPGTTAGTHYYAVHSENPASLLILRLLRLPFTQQIYEAAKQSENPGVRNMAAILAYFSNRPYPDYCVEEWKKTTSGNDVERVSAFLLAMSNKPNGKLFSGGFRLYYEERDILKKLSAHVQTMRDEKLLNVYFHLNYFFLGLINSKKVDFKYEKRNDFAKLMCFAIETVRAAIQELQDNNKLKVDTSDDRKPTKP